MKRFIKYLFLVPLAVILVLLSVANRTPTVFSLDPLNQEAPAIAFELPFFVYLFIALILGMLLGSFLTWLSQGKHRRALRETAYEANQLKQEKASTRENPETGKSPEIAPGLPLISH